MAFTPVREPSVQGSVNVTLNGAGLSRCPAAQWVTILMWCDDDLDVVFVEDSSWIV